MLLAATNTANFIVRARTECSYNFLTSYHAVFTCWFTRRKPVEWSFCWLSIVASYYKFHTWSEITFVQHLGTAESGELTGHCLLITLTRGPPIEFATHALILFFQRP